MKLTFFISRTNQNYRKTLTISESASKIKVIIPSTSEFCLCQQLIVNKNFSMKRRFYDFFQKCKSCDIDQGHIRKPLQSSKNSTKISTLKLSVDFSQVAQFLATFNVLQIVTTFALL